MSAAMLETRQLGKRFGALVVADALEIRLEAGARHALIGPNGAGKTTFVNLVTGRLAPSAGAVLLAGEDVTRLAAAARVHRGLVRTFQINTLFFGLSVLENVVLAVSERERLGWRMLGAAGRRRQVLDEAHSLLGQLGLAPVAAREVRELAYGEQRQLEVAIALAMKPRVLILDEPAAGVAESERELILDTLARLPEEMAILVIEHDMDVVFRFAQRISVLDQGRLIADGTPGEIAADPAVRRVYFGHRELALHD